MAWRQLPPLAHPTHPAQIRRRASVRHGTLANKIRLREMRNNSLVGYAGVISDLWTGRHASMRATAPAELAAGLAADHDSPPWHQGSVVEDLTAVEGEAS